MFDYIRKNFNFSFLKLYIFLFFNTAYAFLTFWITSTLLTFWPFAIFGLFFYIFVVLFNIAFSRGILKREESFAVNNKFPIAGKIFLIVGTIFFAIIYFVGIPWMQSLMITYVGLPELAFKIVGWLLGAISILISFYITFLNKNNSQIHYENTNYYTTKHHPS